MKNPYRPNIVVIKNFIGTFWFKIPESISPTVIVVNIFSMYAFGNRRIVLKITDIFEVRIGNDGN